MREGERVANKRGLIIQNPNFTKMEGRRGKREEEKEEERQWRDTGNGH